MIFNFCQLSFKFTYHSKKTWSSVIPPPKSAIEKNKNPRYDGAFLILLAALFLNNMLSHRLLTFHCQLRKIFSNKFNMWQNNAKQCLIFMNNIIYKMYTQTLESHATSIILRVLNFFRAVYYLSHQPYIHEFSAIKNMCIMCILCIMCIIWNLRNQKTP